MSNHWHLAASAEDPNTLSGYIRWVSATHAVRYRFQTDTRGHGHVYQDRYRAEPIETAVDYIRLVKYIEANPLEAGLVDRAERYQWSSLQERLSGRRRLIEAGPWELPSDWVVIVNTPDFRAELEPSLLGQSAAFRPQPTPFPEFR
jgi:putative transposase